MEESTEYQILGPKNELITIKRIYDDKFLNTRSDKKISYSVQNKMISYDRANVFKEQIYSEKMVSVSPDMQSGERRS